MIASMTYADSNKCNGQRDFNSHNGRDVSIGRNGLNGHHFCNACDVCNDLLGCLDLSERPGYLTNKLTSTL